MYTKITAVLFLLSCSLLYAGPVSTTDANQLTQTQLNKWGEYKIGDYYAYKALVIDKSNPKCIRFEDFINRFNYLSSLLSVKKNNNENSKNKDFELLTLDFFPNDTPFTWVLTETQQTGGDIMEVRKKRTDNSDTVTDSVSEKGIAYYVKDKRMNGMKPMWLGLGKDVFEDGAPFIQFYDRNYAYVLISLGTDYYYMLKIQCEK